MFAKLKEFFEFLWLYFKGFRPVEFVRGDDRVSLHACGWRANGTGRMRRAKDAVAYLDSAEPEQWRQIYCGMTPFLVSDKGNVKHIDGRPAKLFLSNGRYQILYKPEDARGRGRNGRDHKKRVYRSMLVAMAFLDFKKGDDTHEVHHVNGYRTDDRLANLLVLTHEEHTRIHNMGPCALSGTRDDALALLASSAPLTADEVKKANGKKQRVKHDDDKKRREPDAAKADRDEALQDASDKPESDASTDAPNAPAGPDTSAEETAPKPKRRRGKRGGKRHKKASEQRQNCDQGQKHGPDQANDAANLPSETPENETPCDAKPAPSAPTDAADVPASSARTEEPGDARRPAMPDGLSSSADASTAEPHTSSPASAGKTPASPEDATPPASKRAKNAPSEPVDWTAARATLEEQLEEFLKRSTPDAQGCFPADKQLNKWAKPVYRAIKPFLTCQDAVAQFDASLACIRTIAHVEKEWGTVGAAPVQSLLGSLQQLLKDSVKRLAAGDEIERACVEELLREESKKPLYEKTSTARKLRQCISIACSRNGDA